MRITQDSLDLYRAQVDAAADKARAFFARALEAYMEKNPDAGTAAVREFALDLFGTALPNFTDLEAALACDLFDEIAEECGFDGGRARVYDTTDYDVVEGKVRFFADILASGDRQRFVEEVSDVTRFFCKRAAFDNMVANCEAQKVRWARVPTGFETCSFCFMLASRGFAYGSEKKAARAENGKRYHPNCDCIPVPGFQGPDGNPRVRIDGYDPQAMYENWKNCEETIGGRKQARAEWNALPEDERARYIERHGDASRAFASFEQNRIMREVETRDWHWLYTGEFSKEDQAILEMMSSHAVDSQQDRGVADASIIDAVKRPLHHTDVVYDDDGRPSYKVIGRNATIARNPETGVITTVWQTGSSTRRKFERNGNRGIKPAAD